MAARDKYESLKGLSQAIVILLWMQCALSVGYALSTWAYAGHLRTLIAAGGPDVAIDPDAALVPSELAQGMVGLMVVLLSLTLIVLIGRWTYRAAWNVRHLGAKRLSVSAGMAVGWHFIPFANLLMPFRAMKEIWLASHDPAGWRLQGVGLLSAWWALWLLSNFVGNISFRLAMRADTADELFTSEMFSIAGDGLGIVLNLVFIPIVTRLWREQDRQAAMPAPAAEPPLLPAQVEA